MRAFLFDLLVAAGILGLTTLGTAALLQVILFPPKDDPLPYDLAASRACTPPAGDVGDLRLRQ